ncbi:MAG: hypothetical protein ACSI46_06685 [Gloeotrichia echinulata DVL01]|nr:hypothetical protein [Gloeotrichia echinulata DEX184]
MGTGGTSASSVHRWGHNDRSVHRWGMGNGDWGLVFRVRQYQWLWLIDSDSQHFSLADSPVHKLSPAILVTCEYR